MDSQWSMIWTHSNAAAAKAGKTQDGLADPLERTDWEGLGWAIPLISQLVAGLRPRPGAARKVKQVERFTVQSAASDICVS